MDEQYRRNPTRVGVFQMRAVQLPDAKGGLCQTIKWGSQGLFQLFIEQGD